MAKRILIIDDDKGQLRYLEQCLTDPEFEIHTLSESAKAIEVITWLNPDIVLLDLMMPQVDGFSILKTVRKDLKLDTPKIIISSAKTFAYDEQRAKELGANGFLPKPSSPEQIREMVREVAGSGIRFSFWGTRGTYPTPQSDRLKYGGNTSCVMVEFPGDKVFIFDAGTGIIQLGEHFSGQKGKRTKFNIMISHPHWDHIQGLPFFKPAYSQGNEIAIFGTSHADISLRETISGQMKSIYFPVTMREYSARVYFKEILEEEFKVEGITVTTLLLNHPGNTLGYKLTDPNGKSIAYVTDNEIVPEGAGHMDPHLLKNMVQFVEDCDVLIHDSSFTDTEYKTKSGWGHPPLTEVLRLAERAKVKNLYLFHHDPSHDDRQVEAKQEFAMEYIKKRNLTMTCVSAAERTSFPL